MRCSYPFENRGRGVAPGGPAAWFVLARLGTSNIPSITSRHASQASSADLNRILTPARSVSSAPGAVSDMTILKRSTSPTRTYTFTDLSDCEAKEAQLKQRGH